jgi:NAD(P)-dependent dehydrogenase (short-subunit alcohol dehydrogenase family)
VEFSNRTALVTGATGGIGAEIARLLAAGGAGLVLTGRDEQRGKSLVAEIESDGGTAWFLPADLTDPAAVERLAREAGPVDVLINNAALFPVAPTVEQAVEGFDLAVAANIRAPYLLTAALVPAMISRGRGSIVNISTMAARVGMPGLSVYSATKAALEALTRTWAAEFGAAGVRVNAVAPGPTRTEMVLGAMGEEGAAQVAATTLLGRLASPREIAETVVFVASERASYLTGAVIAADAGRTAV